MAQVAVTALASALGGGIVAQATASIVVGVAATALGRQRQRSRAAKPSPVRQQSRTKGGAYPQTMIVGRYATPGHDMCPPYCFDDRVETLSGAPGSSGRGDFLTLVVSLSDVPVTALRSVIVQGTVFDIGTHLVDENDPMGMRVPASMTGEHRRYFDRMWIRFHDGTQTEADPFLRKAFGAHPTRPWQSDMIYSGGSYAIMTVYRQADLWQDLTQVKWVLDGIAVPDVANANAQPSFSRNPVRLAAAISQGIALPGGAQFGLGISEIDVSAYQAAVQACDAAGFTAGLEIAVGTPDGDGEDALDVTGHLLDACLGTFVSDAGRIYFGALDDSLPIAHITDDDVFVDAGISGETVASLAEATNEITISHPNAASAWQVLPAPSARDLDAEARHGERLTTPQTLPAVTDATQAQKLAQMQVKDAQNTRTHVISMGLSKRHWRPMERITWTSDLFPYTVKEFVIEERRSSGFRAAFTIRELNPAHLDPANTNPESFSPAPPTVVVPEPLLVDLSVSATKITLADGRERPATRLNWSLQPAAASQVQWERRVKGDAATESGSVNVAALAVDVVADGPVTYELRARYVAGERETVWSAWQEVTTADLRSASDLAASVNQEIDNASQAAAAAAANATTALNKATAAQTALSTLTDGYAGTLQALDDAVVDAQSAAEAGVQSAAPSILEEPRATWSINPQNPHSEIIKPPVTVGTFVTDDADFGRAYEFGSNTNVTIGHAAPFPLDASRIYKMTLRFKAVSDGSANGIRVRVGATTQNGTTVLASNLQLDTQNGDFLTVADGVQEFTAYCAVDTQPLVDYGVPAGSIIALTNSANANGVHFHIRQNAGGAVSTDGVMRVGEIIIQDVTTVIEAVQVMRTELSASIAGVTATLSQNYYTIVQTDQAIAASANSLTASLQNDIDAAYDQIVSLSVDPGTAFAGLMATLQVDAIGNSATIQSLQQVSQDVDGFSNAFAGLTVETQGGAISGFRATSWSNPDGSGGSLLQLLGNVVVEGTLSANALNVGLQKNLLSNTDFSDGLEGWHFATSGANQAAETSISLHTSGNHSGPGYPTLRIHQNGAGTGGFADLVHQPSLTDGVNALGVAVTPGAWYEVSAQISTIHCDAQLFIKWLDADGVTLDYTIELDRANNSGSSPTNPDIWPVYWGKAQAPANAALATPVIRKRPTDPGNTSSTIYIHKPQFALSAANASLPTPYSPGGTTMISGDKIRTGTVITRHLSAAAVIAANINTTNFQAAGLAVFGGVLQSPNFVAGSAGWQITQAGNAEFNQVTIRRQIRVATGAVAFSAFPPRETGSGSTQNSGLSSIEYALPGYSIWVVDTPIPLSAWLAPEETYLVTAGMSATVSADPSKIPDVRWGWVGKVVPLTRWSGNQSLALHFEFWSRNVTNVAAGVLNWNLYRVS